MRMRAKASSPLRPLQVAQEYHALGWNVLPVAKGEKGPRVAWAKWQHESQQESNLERLFGARKECNFWIVCGQTSGVVVADTDSAEAEQWLLQRAPEAAHTWQVKTAKGTHFYFRCPEEGFASRNLRTQGVEIDLRGDGAGVVVPPSTHSSGADYVWVVDPWGAPGALRDLPEVLGLSGATDGEGGQENPQDAGGRSLPALLRRAAKMREGQGRNDLFTRICGHRAREHWSDWKTFLEAVRADNEVFPEPLDWGEARKTAKSVWRAEQDRREGLTTKSGSPAEWALVERGGFLYVTNGSLVEPWGNFDLKVEAYARDDERGVMWYQVKMGARSDFLSSATLSSPQRLSAWLAGHEVGVVWKRKLISAGVLLQTYLAGQDAPMRRVYQHHGWQNGFVYDDIEIHAEGTRPSGGIVVTQREWAPFVYGFREQKEVRGVLREVLTFQEDTVSSVFGAWWAATFLKGQLERYTSLFPFLALESPSESGKTHGFFAQMVQLSGAQIGPGHNTGATLRDRLSAHRNGIVWVDDKTRVDADLDLIRLATSEEHITKMGADFTRHERRQLVAPVVLSGESLGSVVTSKAYMDRAVLLTAPSPVNRKSRHDRSRLQWDDVQALQMRYGHLSCMAGTVVQMALQWTHLIDRLPRLRQGVGRNADKWAVLMLGAYVLAHMTRDKRHVARVERWISEQYDSVSVEDALTFLVVPEMWRESRYPRRAWRTLGQPHPVWYDEENDCGWVNMGALAAEWLKYAQRNRIYDPRTQDKTALARQRRAAGINTSRLLGLPDRNHKARFWIIPPELWDRIAERADAK